MKKKLIWAAVALLALVALIVGAGLLMDNYNTKTVQGDVEEFKGKVTEINQIEGACKYIVIDNKYSVNVECPDSGVIPVAPYTGEYDKNIRTGDEVKAQAVFNLEADGVRHYDTNKTGTYVKLR